MDSPYEKYVLALIVGLPATLTSIASIVFSAKKLKEIHVIMNSRLTQLITSIEDKAVTDIKLSKVEGDQEGYQRGKKEK